MNELCHLPGFRHDAKLIEETGTFWRSHIYTPAIFNPVYQYLPIQSIIFQVAFMFYKFSHKSFPFSLSAVNTDTGVVDAYQHMSPMVDTVMYMQWLYKQCKDKGCRFVHDEIKGLLRDQAEDLKKKYKAQLIFNCSGLSAKELAGDEDVYPLRGN